MSRESSGGCRAWEIPSASRDPHDRCKPAAVSRVAEFQTNWVPVGLHMHSIMSLHTSRRIWRTLLAISRKCRSIMIIDELIGKSTLQITPHGRTLSRGIVRHRSKARRRSASQIREQRAQRAFNSLPKVVTPTWTRPHLSRSCQRFERVGRLPLSSPVGTRSPRTSTPHASGWGLLGLQSHPQVHVPNPPRLQHVVPWELTQSHSLRICSEHGAALDGPRRRSTGCTR